MDSVQGGYRSEQHARCANHQEVAALAKCCRCKTALCDVCVPFVINQDVWCEPCGAGVVEETRIPWGKVAVVLAVGLPIVFAIWVFPFFTAMERTMPIYVLLAGFFAVGGVAAKVAQTTAGEAPIVSRRAPGSPLPSAAKRL
jgi:hypothetical protein